MRPGTKLLLATTILWAVPAVAQQAPTALSGGPTVADPAKWPKAASQGLVDPATEKFVSDLMAKMTLEEKVGQMIQADIGSIKPEDLRQYPLGSILAGGNSPPLSGNDRSPTGRLGGDCARLPRRRDGAASGPRPDPADLRRRRRPRQQQRHRRSDLPAQYRPWRGERSRIDPPHRRSDRGRDRGRRPRLGVRPDARRAAGRPLGPQL